MEILRADDVAVDVVSFDLQGDGVRVSFGAGDGAAVLEGPREEVCAVLVRALAEITR